MPDPIYCEQCGATVGLEFIPMLEGQVYAQCPCGHGWELKPVEKPIQVQ